MLNYGISGDTTAGGLGRVDDVLSQKPDIVIIELGGNDLMRAFPPAITKENLDNIVKKIQSKGAKIILTGHIAPLNYGQKYAKNYNAIFPDIASKYNLKLYPAIMKGVIGHPENIQADGVHPTPAGVDVMVEGISPLVKELLAK